MNGQEFLSMYPAKLMEYGLAIGYLLLFVPFWRYLHGAKKPSRRSASENPAVAAKPAAAVLPRAA